MSDSYYALTVMTVGGAASTPAYYSLSPTSNLTISQGGVTLYPSTPSQQMISVSVYPQTLQINAAAGVVSGGVTIITSASEVAGRLLVSPPVNVAVAVTLYGAGGKQLGQYIADPGTGGGVFNFPVSGSDGIPAEDAQGVVDSLIAKK